jgi:hypothetical protein
LDEVIELDDRTLDREYAIAKMCLADIIADKGCPSFAKMKAVKEFFEIAALRKKVEAGEDLHIKFDDKAVAAIRKRLRLMVVALDEALKKFVPDQQARRDVMEYVRTRVRLTGNVTGVADGMAVVHTRPQVVRASDK